MSRERLYLFDTTLRDGNQTRGVDFNVDDKNVISELLDDFGIDYIEGGWPGANPTDTDFFHNPPVLNKASLTAFGMTRRPDKSVDSDSGLQLILKTNVKAICLVGKSWDYHVDIALKTNLHEAIKIISDSISAVASSGKESIFDAEHFFDGYKANPKFAINCLKAALNSGARWVVLCDTNGGTLPHEVFDIVSKVTKEIPGENLGIHAQNDTENAVSNSLAAVLAGVRQLQGTLNGLGERCGNANLVSLIPTLMLKEEFAKKFEIQITKEKLKNLTHLSRFLDDRLNRAPNVSAPYVGISAFSHKGGLHGSAVVKDPRTYEHVTPEDVGNRRYVLVSDQAGKANVIARLTDLGIDIEYNDERLNSLINKMKILESKGYSYDGAEASFELLALRSLEMVPEYFEVDSFRVIVERRYNAVGELITTSDATVKTIVDGKTIISVGEGNGPVNALDHALRKDLGKYSSFLSDLTLVDYKVRILTQGTGAVTRVTVESMDSSGVRWSTIGVSPNIIDASFQALYDAVVFKLFHSNAPARVTKSPKE